MPKTSDLSPNFEKTAANVLETTKRELEAAAKSHGVKIKANQMTYAVLEKLTIAQAPIAGIDKYKDADFEAGAPVQLLLIKTTTRVDIPSGSYVVKCSTVPERPPAKLFSRTPRALWSQNGSSSSGVGNSLPFSSPTSSPIQVLN